RQSLRVVRTLGDDGVALELEMPGDQAMPDGPRPARTGDRVHDIGDLHTHLSEFTRDGGFEVRAPESYAEKERLPPCRSIPRTTCGGDAASQSREAARRQETWPD